jgi:DNA-binding SARP family transcriptional activator
MDLWGPDEPVCSVIQTSSADSSSAVQLHRYVQRVPVQGRQPPPIAIDLLGGFCVRAGGRRLDEVDWPQRRPKALVKWLALAPGHRLHREQVMDGLWPELDAASAGNNLRKAVFRARSAVRDLGVGVPELIVSQGDLLMLSPGTWVDVTEFEATVAQARVSKDVGLYRAAIALWQGELLPEDLYEDWAASRREVLHHEAVAVLAELAAALEARAELDEAAGLLRRARAIDPTNEESARALLRVLALSGGRSEATSVYQSLCEALERELGTRPAVETVELHEQIVMRQEAAPAQTAQRWEHIGDLRMTAGDSVGAYAAFGSALTGRSEPESVARLERKSAQALLATHDSGPAGSHLDRAEASAALADTAQDPSPEEAQLRAARSLWFCEIGDLDSAAIAADDARALAEGAGDPAAVAAAYEAAAVVCHYRGVWREDLLAQVSRLGTAIEDGALSGVFDLHHCIGQFHLYGDGLADDVEDYARHLLEVAGRRSARRMEAFGWCLLGEALMLRGRLDEAEGCLTRSAEIHAGSGGRSGGLPWQRLGEVAASRGDFDAARAAVTRGMAIATVSGMARHLWGRLYATSAFIALEQGDPTAAIRAVSSAEAAAARYGDCPTCSAQLHPFAAEAFAACGDRHAALRHAHAATATAISFPSSAWSGMAEHAHGAAVAAAGDTDLAHGHFEAAAALFDKARHVLWAERSRRRAAALSRPG